jgi:hypothetical protein
MTETYHRVTGEKIRDQKVLDNSDIITVLVMPCYCDDRSSKDVANDRYHWRDGFMVSWNSNYGPEECWVIDLKTATSLKTY